MCRQKSGICTVVFVVMYACKIMFACNVGWLIFLGYITCELTIFPICLQFGFFRRGPRHVIKMQIHVWHTNMVSLNRFWNMLYLTFHGFESLNSREIRLTPSSYDFLWFIIHRNASAEILKWFDGIMKVAFSACASLVIPTVFTGLNGYWMERVLEMKNSLLLFLICFFSLNRPIYKVFVSLF